MQDVIGDSTPLVITISRPIHTMLTLSEKLSRSISVDDFRQGNINLKVRSIDGNALIPVGSGRLKTAYVFNDGVTEGQTQGGFVPASTAKTINWIITPRTAPIAVSKTDKMRIFDPETYY